MKSGFPYGGLNGSSINSDNNALSLSPGWYQGSHMAFFWRHFSVLGALPPPQWPNWRLFEGSGAVLSLSGYLIKTSEYNNL